MTDAARTGQLFGALVVAAAAYFAWLRLQPLTGIDITARRIPEPAGSGGTLAPIDVTAQRLPVPSTGIIGTVTGAVTGAQDWLSMQIGDGIDAVKGLLTPRGLRNHNPGNLRAGIKWQGLASPDRDSGGYAIFVSDAAGVRALSRDLGTKVARGLNTIRKILNVYAPTFENDTASYIAAVSGALGIGPDAVIPWPARRVDLIAAIIRHENGRQPFARADLETWAALA